jgi:hypothetical protein
MVRVRVKSPVVVLLLQDLPEMTAPSSPAFSAIWGSGTCNVLRTTSIPCFWSSLSTFSLARVRLARA